MPITPGAAAIAWDTPVRAGSLYCFYTRPMHIAGRFHRVYCTVLYCATLSSISSRSKFESDDEWKHDTGCAGRTQQVWDVLFKTVAAEDPSSHLTSLHNDKYLYNLSQPWLTHYSIQHVHNRPADLWRIFGRKPFVWDEVKYEGDVPKNWGSLRPGQMVDKFWWGAACGAYSGTL